jgi:hypothetical protein
LNSRALLGLGVAPLTSNWLNNQSIRVGVQNTASARRNRPSHTFPEALPTAVENAARVGDASVYVVDWTAF